MKVHKRILPIIVFSQFCCTSLWFAGNGVMHELILAFGLDAGALGHLTSAVQFGFITGTLVFAILTIADRFSPSRVFLFSALLGGLFNLGTIWDGNTFGSLIFLRFATGFFLAGIYPVGMKIAADYFEKGLGVSLGYLVGALVVGTAFPHILNGFSFDLPWERVLIFTSSISAVGGLLMAWLVPNGPYRKKSQKIDFSAFTQVFAKRKFKAAAFGYFGHMWELYGFWAFVPIILSEYQAINPLTQFNTALFSFLIIGLGGLACVAGGYLSKRYGHQKVAATALFLSGLCCLISPLSFGLESPLLFLIFLIFWGLVVIADSPLFSTMVANNAEAQIKGTALTIVNCIGFAITIVSIQIINYAIAFVEPKNIFIILSVGPILGLIAIVKFSKV